MLKLNLFVDVVRLLTSLKVPGLARAPCSFKYRLLVLYVQPSPQEALVHTLPHDPAISKTPTTRAPTRPLRAISSISTISIVIFIPISIPNTMAYLWYT